MVITKKLRDFMVTKHGVKADASDDALKSATLEKIGLGAISLEEVSTLTKEDPNEKEQLILKALSRLQGNDGLVNPAKPAALAVGADEPGIDALAGAIAGAQRAGASDARVKKATEKAGFSYEKKGSVWRDQPFRAPHGIKGVAEPETCNRPGAPAYYWERRDERVEPTQRFLDVPSKAEYAKMGAIFKHNANIQLGPQLAADLPWMKMSELDQEMVQEAIEEDNWVGGGTGLDGRKLMQKERQIVMTKAVLEATGDASGGSNAVPQYFDMEAIRIPLLYGELLPWVELVPTDRGRAAHTYTIQTPSYVSTVEGTTITPFSTSGFVGTLDTSFFPATCAFEWGRDFEADSAPNFGELVMAQLGDNAKTQIDFWIAVGDGVTQPQGLANATGTVVSAQGANTHTSMLYTDFLNLVYGVTKPYRKNFGGDSSRFVMGDPQYKKAMQITTGVTGDTRPIFGMALKDYRLGDYGVSVQNSIAQGSLFFCNLRGYRLYQRKGIYYDLVTTGRTLALSQTKMLVARMRYGGQIVLSGYLAQMTNADAR